MHTCIHVFNYTYTLEQNSHKMSNKHINLYLPRDSDTSAR